MPAPQCSGITGSMFIQVVILRKGPRHATIIRPGREGIVGVFYGSGKISSLGYTVPTQNMLVQVILTEVLLLTRNHSETGRRKRRRNRGYSASVVNFLSLRYIVPMQYMLVQVIHVY